MADEVQGPRRGSEGSGADLPPLRLRRSVAAPIAALMLLVMLASGASAWVIIDQLRDLRANFDLLTGVYVPFQERLFRANLQSSRIGMQVAAASDEELGRVSEGELLRFEDALAERTRLVEEIRQPIDQGLAHSERFSGAEHVERLRTLSRMVDALAVSVAEAEADDPADVLVDARRQNEIRRGFKELAEFAAQTVRTQREAVAAAGRRAENLAVIATLLTVSMALVASIAVILTLRPLRKLNEGVRRFGQGDRDRRINLGSGPPHHDDEVSRLAREFNLMADALAERERRLIRQERLAAVGQLAAQITHEIRNPLSSVALNVELLEDEVGDPEAVDDARLLLRRISGEVDRLTAITEDYLSFARRPNPALEPMDLAAELEELLDFLAGEHDMAGIDVRKEGLEVPTWVEGDAGQLRQAFLNLLRNAREAVEAAAADAPGRTRRLEVSLERKDDEVIAVVGDTGAGIDVPEADLDRIFEAFFTRKREGTGLGLPMVQQIVNDHHGTIRVASTSPEGTRFEVRLPACAPS